jgi:hypothetical protein
MAFFFSLVQLDVMVVDAKERVGTGYTLGVGGGAPRIALATTCKPFMILLSAEGTGTERYKWQNLTVSEMTWLLMSVLTNLKQR